MKDYVNLDHGRGWASADAAASIARVDAVLGHAMQITEAGRSKEKADANYAAYVAYLNGTGPWAPIALPGDQSVHCFGGAIDTDEGQSHVDLLADHGWIRTVYRNGRLVEPWHFEYFTARDNHYNEEIDDMFTDEDRARAIALEEKVAWLMDQHGGSSKRKTSAREDIDKILAQVTETAQIIGSSLARARKGDTLGVRLDKVIAHLSGRKPLTKDD